MTVSIAKVFKPFNNFESKYAGLDTVKNPIAVPGSLDRNAGKEGYDPNLIEGIPTFMGGKVLIYLPRFLNGYGQPTPGYTYRILWRIRSLEDSVTDPSRESTYHLGKNLVGRAEDPESSDVAANKRFVIPAAVETYQFPSVTEIIADPRNAADASLVAPQGVPTGETSDPEPITVSVGSAQYQTYRSSIGYWSAPLTENYPGADAGNPRVGVAGMVSQGVYEYAQRGGATVSDENFAAGYLGGPIYSVIETVAKGDEMIVLISRDSIDGPWEFDGLDKGLSELLGNANGTQQPIPNTGIIVFSQASR